MALYDDVLIDILYENGIPQLVNELTGAELNLGNVHLRITKEGDRYQSWHCDRYFEEFPDLKLFYYPHMGDASKPVLHYIPCPRQDKYLQSLLRHRPPTGASKERHLE